MMNQPGYKLQRSTEFRVPSTWISLTRWFCLAKNMKGIKAAGPSDIITEMLNTVGAKSIEFLRELFPDDGEMTFI